VSQVEFVDDAPGKDIFVEFAELTLANGFYRGTLYDGIGLLRHGTGVMKYNDGSVYSGAWDMNVIEGTGVMKYADGSTYDGLWHQGEYHGLGYLVMAVDYRTYDCYLGEVRLRYPLADYCTEPSSNFFDYSLARSGSWGK
jgi:hypothetical protein